MKPPFSSKQLEFMTYSTAKWNLAWGSVRCGKTVGTVFRFLEAVNNCPDSDIYIVGHTFDTAYRNVVRLIMESSEFEIFRPFCTWSGKKLFFKDKVITVLGAKDEGAIGQFQGVTMSLVYCDEITLYPISIIEMIDTRLSRTWSMAIATMNPSHPKHKIKEWIDKADEGDKNYYSLKFTLDDNPYVEEEYKERIRKSLSGVFYRRNYLGEWCLAEGAIFDFFDTNIHVVDSPPRAADYWVAGIDYGAVNPFCCLLLGVSTGKYAQTGKIMWVEKEYYWNPNPKTGTGRQKTNSEFADDLQKFLQDYSVKQIYIDPSAAAFKVEMRKRGMATVDANNEVLDGITMLSNELNRGTLVICKECKNTIREIEGYVWDTKSAERGKDEPVKKDDHAVDALRYIIATHKVETYQPYKNPHDAEQYQGNRFNSGRRSVF